MYICMYLLSRPGFLFADCDGGYGGLGRGRARAAHGGPLGQGACAQEEWVQGGPPKGAQGSD